MDVKLMDGLKERMPMVVQAWGRRWTAVNQLEEALAVVTVMRQ